MTDKMTSAIHPDPALPSQPGLPTEMEVSQEKPRFSFLRLLVLMGLGVGCLFCIPYVQLEAVRWMVSREVTARGGHIVIGAMKGSLWEGTIVFEQVRLDGAAGEFRAELDVAAIEVVANVSRVFGRETGFLEQVSIRQGTMTVHRMPNALAPVRADGTGGSSAVGRRSRFDAFLKRLEPQRVRVEGCGFLFQGGRTRLGWDQVWLEADERGGWIATGTGRGRWNRYEAELPAMQGEAFWRDGVLSIRNAALGEATVRAAELDLAAVGERQLSAGFSVAAFGGLARAGLHFDLADVDAAAEISGTARGIDAARLAGFLGREGIAGGRIEDVRFSFRGDPWQAREGSGAVRLRVNGLRWKERTWDSAVIGATISHRGIDIQTFELSQPGNRVDFSGLVEWPGKDSRAGLPRFRIAVDALVSNLSMLAIWPGNWEIGHEGSLRVVGDIENSDEGARGHLELEGRDLKVTGANVDFLDASIRLAGGELSAERLRFGRGDDVLEGRALVGWQPVWRYEAELKGRLSSLAPYQVALQRIPGLPNAVEDVEGQWSGDGTAEAHSGAFYVKAKEVTVRSGVWADVLLSATYSPGQMYFDRFEMTKGRGSLTAKLAVSPRELRMDDLQWRSQGGGKVSGWLKLPLGFAAMQRPSAAGPSVWERGQVGGDVQFTATDLEELARFFGMDSPAFGGVANGRLSVSGLWVAPVWQGALDVDRGWFGRPASSGGAGEALSDVKAVLAGKGTAVLGIDQGQGVIAGLEGRSVFRGAVVPLPGPWFWYVIGEQKLQTKAMDAGFDVERVLKLVGWAGGEGGEFSCADVQWSEPRWEGFIKLQTGLVEGDGIGLKEVAQALEREAEELRKSSPERLRVGKLVSEPGSAPLGLMLVSDPAGGMAVKLHWTQPGQTGEDAPDDVDAGRAGPWVLDTLELTVAPGLQLLEGSGVWKIEGFKPATFELAGDALTPKVVLKRSEVPPAEIVAREAGLSEDQLVFDDTHLMLPAHILWRRSD